MSKRFLKLATVTRMGTKDILEQVNPKMVRVAYEHGMGLSAYMDRLCPRENGDTSGLDAFGRVMREAGIYTRSKPEAGLFADVWEDVFDETEPRRVLGLEWVRRQWLQVSRGTPGATRAIETSQDYPINSAMRPYTDAAQLRDEQFTPAIPLSALVAITTPIAGDTYRTVYLQDVDPKAKRKVRVGETAEIPRVQLLTSEHVVQLYKYGRVIEASYEVLRRQRLDRVAMEIKLMAIQAEVDKVATVLDVMINGDGNTNTAADSYNLTTLDPATTANNASLASWISFKLKFKNPYMMNILLAQEGGIMKAMLINTGSANIPLVTIAGAIGLGGFTNINSTLRDNVAYGVTDDAPANKWVGADSRRAIERVTEIGADITEVERFATRQTQAIVMTEVEGYGVLDHHATKIANLAA